MVEGWELFLPAREDRLVFLLSELGIFWVLLSAAMPKPNPLCCTILGTE